MSETHPEGRDPAEVRRGGRAGRSRCGEGILLRQQLRLRRSDHVGPVQRRRNQRPARGGGRRVARLRQPDRAHRAAAGRDGARPRLRRRHRRAAVGAPRRAGREGLRPRHDRRDAGARAREPAEGGRHQRRVPEGRDRAHPAARQLGRRDHLELRHQPVVGQGAASSAKRSGCSGPAAASRSRTSSCAARCRPTSAGASSCGSAASPARSRNPSTGACSARPGFEAIDVEPWRIYKVAEAREFLAEAGIDPEALAGQVDGKFASAFVRATKPQAKSCCGPECCK